MVADQVIKDKRHAPADVEHHLNPALRVAVQVSVDWKVLEGVRVLRNAQRDELVLLVAVIQIGRFLVDLRAYTDLRASFCSFNAPGLVGRDC